MGYYAHGDGSITLSVWNSKVENAISNVFEYDEGDISISAMNGSDGNTAHDTSDHEPGKSYTVSVWIDDKYYSDSIEETFAEITPYTMAGSVRFIGEDGCAWEHYYDPAEQKWKEDGATIIFPSETTVEAGHKDIADRKIRLYTLFAESLMKQFHEYGIDQYSSVKDLPNFVKTYRDVFDCIIANEVWLQEYIAEKYIDEPESHRGRGWIIRQSDIDQLIKSTAFYTLMSNCE